MRGPLRPAWEEILRPEALEFVAGLQREFDPRRREYDVSRTDPVTVTVEGDRAFAQLTGQGRNQIFPQSETTFFLKVVDAQLEFSADASSVVLHQNGRSQKAPRK